MEFYEKSTSTSCAVEESSGGVSWLAFARSVLINCSNSVVLTLSCSKLSCSLLVLISVIKFWIFSLSESERLPSKVSSCFEAW